MEFVEIAAILGGVLSVISAIVAFRSIEKRLDVEEDLEKELQKYFEQHYQILLELERVESKGEIKSEISKHLVMYENLLNDIVISMPDEKRNKVYPAINQISEKGKVAYISKTISRSLAKA